MFPGVLVHHVFTRLTLAALTLMGVTAAHATPAVTHLSFSNLLNFSAHMTVDHTVGGTLDITPVGGKLLVNVLGELGVSSRLIGDYSINKGEGILFNFSQKVSLTGWDMDDLPGGPDHFSLRVDGGLVQPFSLRSTGPGSSLVGSSFQFGWLGESYFIDSVKFMAWSEPVNPGKPGPLVTAVPEPSTAALMLACGGVFAFMARRKSVN
jgi:PEP-CTERM motif